MELRSNTWVKVPAPCLQSLSLQNGYKIHFGCMSHSSMVLYDSSPRVLWKMAASDCPHQEASSRLPWEKNQLCALNQEN